LIREVEATATTVWYEGVGQYIKNKAVLNWFRKITQHYDVPLAKQAELAALLLNEAVEHNRGRGLTLPFLKDRNYEDYIPSFVEHDGPVVDEQIGEQIKLEAVQDQLQRALKDLYGARPSCSAVAGRWMGCLNNIPRCPSRSITTRVVRSSSPKR